MTTRTYGTFPRTISCIMVAVALIMLATPVWAQNGVSQYCPQGLRTVDDHMKEAPDLSCANLYRAELSRARLSYADLRGANLREARLTLADLYGADLSGAVLREADLQGANLQGANLQGADLTGAILSGATYNASTTFSPDFHPVAAGMILQE